MVFSPHKSKRKVIKIKKILKIISILLPIIGIINFLINPIGKLITKINFVEWIFKNISQINAKEIFFTTLFILIIIAFIMKIYIIFKKKILKFCGERKP